MMKTRFASITFVMFFLGHVTTVQASDVPQQTTQLAELFHTISAELLEATRELTMDEVVDSATDLEPDDINTDPACLDGLDPYPRCDDMD